MDVNQREGNYPPPLGTSDILGVDISGTVEGVGKKVTQFTVGDNVFGLLSGGAYAEYAVLEQDLAMKKPNRISFQEAASIPETWFTAYQALFLVAGIERNQDILVHAGASGVGTAIVQLAAHLAFARRVIVTVGSDEKAAFCQRLGATHCINYKTHHWATEIQALTNNRGVHLIVDMVGAEYLKDNIDSLATDGRMVILAFLSVVSGNMAKNVDLAKILRKRIRIEGTALRSRPLAYRKHLRDEVYDKVVVQQLARTDGQCKIVIDRTFQWENIVEAHNYIESNRSKGKIVVNVT